MNNTKQRSKQLQSLAREIVRASDPDLNEIVPILPLAKQLMAAGDCKIDAAKRHVARSIRNARYHWLVDTGQISESESESEPPKQMGGVRPGAGRPRKNGQSQM